MTSRPAPPPPAAVLAVPVWDRFIERSGIAASLALLVTIVSLTVARQRHAPLAPALAGSQLLLVLIVLGCVGVLSYRSSTD